jgi:hypothetical protein
MVIYVYIYITHNRQTDITCEDNTPPGQFRLRGENLQILMKRRASKPNFSMAMVWFLIGQVGVHRKRYRYMIAGIPNWSYVQRRFLSQFFYFFK